MTKNIAQINRMVNTPVSHSMQTAVFKDHRLTCTGLASFISQIFKNTIKRPWDWYYSTCTFFTLQLALTNDLQKPTVM
jgi:hypothetical protein